MPPDELTAVYQALGVEADVVETVAGMSLIFRDGCLEVSEACAERDDLMEALTGTLIYFWRPCRSLVLGCMTGLQNLANMVLGIKEESKYHVNGFARMSAHVKKFVFTLTMCSHPRDSLPRVSPLVIVGERHGGGAAPDHIRTPRSLLVDRFFTQCLVVRREERRERARAKEKEKKKETKKEKEETRRERREETRREQRGEKRREEKR